MSAPAVACVDEVLAVGQVLMLETQPDVAECMIVARGHSAPARVACRAVFVSDERAVRRSAVCTKRRFVELSPGCFVVQFDRHTAVRVLAPSTPPNGDALRTVNTNLDELYLRRSRESRSDLLDAEIAELEEKAAAIIADRSDARLRPLRAHFADAVRSAKALVGKP